MGYVQEISMSYSWTVTGMEAMLIKYNPRFDTVEIVFTGRAKTGLLSKRCND